jgi:hypothetical protein
MISSHPAVFAREKQNFPPFSFLIHLIDPQGM